MVKRWTKSEENKVIKLIKEEKTYEEIGEIVGRTSRSVREKLRKLGHKYSNYYDGEKNKITKRCENCNKHFDSYIKEERKYCSRSCSVSSNNRISTKNKNGINSKYPYCNVTFCLNCNKRIKGHSKIYCNKKCNVDHNKKILFNKIESGDTTLNTKQYKKYLINKHGNKCMECGWCEINPQTKNVPIQLDHINGDSNDNSLINLRLLCPNCHSLTPTYGFLNKGNGRSERQRYRNQLKDLTIDELIEEKKKVNSQ